MVDISSSASTGIGFFSTLRNILLIMFVSVLLLQIVVICVQDESIDPGIKLLGNKFGLMTDNLKTESQKIIDNNGTGIYMSNPKTLIDFLITVYLILEPLFIIFVWIQVLSFFIVRFILWDTSKTSVGWLLSLIFFFIIQMLFIALFTENSILTPFTAFITFFKAVLVLLTPLANALGKFLE